MRAVSSRPNAPVAASPRAPFLAVLGTAVLASLGACLLVQALRPREVAAPPTGEEVPRRVDQLEQRLAQIERRLVEPERLLATGRDGAEEHVGERGHVGHVAAAADRVPVATAPADVIERVLALERRLARLEQGIGPLEPAPPADGDAAATAAAAAPSLADDQRTIVDPAATVAQKVAAHRRLRHVADAYTPAMVDELVRIATCDADAEVRAQTWCFFDGASAPPALLAPLLQAIGRDPSPRPREEAAETLGNYGDAPGAVAALEAAAAHDPDSRVRHKARRTLAEMRGSPWPFELGWNR